MRRREFIAGLGGMTAAWPLTARAQQQKLRVIGFLSSTPAPPAGRPTTFTDAFRRGIREAGYVEEQNLAIENRYAENEHVRLPSLAADLVRRRVAVIVAAGTAEALAAKAATTTIPIVFLTGGDPVALGLVASLNRPGANLTGHTILDVELGPKKLQLLHEVVPNAGAFGILVDPAFPAVQSNIADLQAAARTLGLQLIVVNARTDGDFETAFDTFSQQCVGAVLVGNSTFFNRRRFQLAALAARHALPTIFAVREFVLAGGLMSYGPSIVDVYHQWGIYTGRILKGDRPADLPVQRLTKIELVINLTTAKALGLTVPETLLATANEVIQ
jgi:putative tryptophan/tyrosine transport system substrate-binding protein